MSSFITNSRGSLKDRLSELVDNSKELKFLVGFFFFSGISELYESIKGQKDISIDVLVGLSADRGIHGIQEFADNTTRLTQKEKVERYFDSIRKTINSNDFDNKQFYEQIHYFIDLICTGKLRIRKTLNPNHAKLYIFNIKDSLASLKKSFFITGSSNFTRAGLGGQEEFNVEISDYGTEGANEHFDKLWESAIKITESPEFQKQLIEIIKHETLIAEITPFEAWAMILSHYLESQKQGDISEATIKLLEAKGYKPYKYQLDAVSQALGMLEEQGGVIVADVVGLGKSVVAGMIAKQLGKRGVVICPPGLIGDDNDKSGWNKYISDFELWGWKAKSSGNLENVFEFVREQPDIEVVIIDEAHRFRNQDTAAYEILSNICRGRKVILLTATPFNNSPADIYALLKLFVVPGQTTLSIDSDLSSEFRRYKEDFKKIANIQKDSSSTNETKRNNAKRDYASLFGESSVDIDKVRQRAKYLASRIRQRIEPVVIRRNRIDLKNDPEYSSELGALSVVADPEKAFFELSKEQSDFYDEVINTYFSEDGRFTGAIYRPYIYETGVDSGEVVEGSEENFEYQKQNNLFQFMRRLLIKRFESSFGAFEKSISNFKRINERYKNFVELTGEFILDRKILDNFESMTEDEILERLSEYEKSFTEEQSKKNKNRRYNLSTFKDAAGFKKAIQSDIDLLSKIEDELNKLRLQENDPKYASLVKSIREIIKKKDEKTEPERKVIIFTEYEDTARYVYEKLEKDFPNEVVSGFGTLGVTKIQNILENFDASQKKAQNEYQILIGTDKISEGFNLSRAGAIVNYDIPWNPTRVIQRVGRINRIGQKIFSKLYIYNFFPTIRGAEYVRNEEIAAQKLFMIHNTLGEDSKIFHADENPTAAGLFQKIQANPESLEDESFITSLRKYHFEMKEKYPEILAKVKRMPIRVKVAKKYDENDLLVFIRKGNAFFVRGIVGNGEVDDVIFENVVHRVKCEADALPIPLGATFWEDYVRVREHQDEYRAQQGATSLETKARNNIQTLLTNPPDVLEVFLPFARTLLEDYEEFQTLGTYTSRRIASLKIADASREELEETSSQFVALQAELGLDYLDKIKKTIPQSEREVVIAVENRKN